MNFSISRFVACFAVVYLLGVVITTFWSWSYAKMIVPKRASLFKSFRGCGLFWPLTVPLGLWIVFMIGGWKNTQKLSLEFAKAAELES